MTGGAKKTGIELAASPQASFRWWHAITVILLALLELGWALPWYRLWTFPIYHGSLVKAALTLGGVMLGTYAILQFLENVYILEGIQQAARGALLAVSLVMGITLLIDVSFTDVMVRLFRLDESLIVLVLTLVWFWWRGQSMVGERILPVIIWRRFLVGLIGLMAYVVMIYSLGGLEFGRLSYGWSVLYLLVGLLALTLGRITYISSVRGAQRNPFDRRWLVSAVLSLGWTVALAALLGSLMTGQFLLLLDLLSTGMRALGAILLIILSIPAALVVYLFEPLSPQLGDAYATMVARLATPAPGSETSFPTPPPAEVPFWVSSLFFWVFILILLAILVARIRSRRRKEDYVLVYEPESLLKPGEARQLLRKAVQDMLDGLLGRFRRTPPGPDLARVRQIYAALLDLSAELNVPRPEGKTPWEFLPDLGALFNAFRSDLALITHIYVRVRYGEYPESAEEVEQLEAAWKSLAEEGERLRKAAALKEKLQKP